MSDKPISKQKAQSLYDRLGGKPEDQASSPLFDEAEYGTVDMTNPSQQEDEVPGLGATAAEDKQALEQQLGEKHAQLLRAHADMQNLRRRMDKEVAQARKFAVERFVNDLLPVIDSLEKACQHAYSHPDAKEIHDGIDLTLKMFITCLQSSGVEVIDPQADQFNPEFHEAMTLVDQPGADKNSIIEVLQKGYVLNGRLVRPARVIVAK